MCEIRQIFDCLSVQPLFSSRLGSAHSLCSCWFNFLLLDFFSSGTCSYTYRHTLVYLSHSTFIDCTDFNRTWWIFPMCIINDKVRFVSDHWQDSGRKSDWKSERMWKRKRNHVNSASIEHVYALYNLIRNRVYTVLLYWWDAARKMEIAIEQTQNSWQPIK